MLRQIASETSSTERIDESEEVLHGVIAFGENELGDNHPVLISTLNSFGDCGSRAGRTEEAGGCFRSGRHRNTKSGNRPRSSEFFRHLTRGCCCFSHKLFTNI